MEKINHTDFMKKVFKKGKFEQYIVSPYASEERNNYSKVLVLSDKVDEPTLYTYRRKPTALILPYSDDTKSVATNNLESIKNHVGAHATYFGVFDFDNRLLFTI